MRNDQKFLRSILLFVAALVLVIAPVAGFAEETGTYLTAEQYIEQARPYLHLSCKGAWEQVKEDADGFIAIIDKVATIGFINHELDVEALGKLPEKELEAFRVAYYTRIGDQCKANPNNLLAGVVEEALLETFSTIQPDAEKK